MTMMKNNRSNRVTNFSIQQYEDEVRDQMESGTTNKEYGLRDLYSNNTPMEQKNRIGNRTYCNLSTRRMLVVFGTLIGIVVIFFVNFLPTLMTQLQPPNIQDARAISLNDSEVDKQKLGDGCYHIFLDVGSNIGVHSRFLFEPSLYPNAKNALSIFDKEFGVHRNNKDICAFGFEPNPIHKNRHSKLMNEYNNMGWRYHYIQAGASDEAGNITFYRNQDDQGKEEWAFSNQDRTWDKGTHGLPVNVTTVRLSTWLRDEILDRKMPDTIHGEYENGGPKVVMKLDIESSEYKVLPDLMFTGILCKIPIDFLFGEIHDWPINHDADPISGRGELHLPRETSRQFLRDGVKMFHSFKDCTTRIEELDDEAYLHDGMPFPSDLLD